MKRLNIFVDETGDFGFGNGSSELYGISFTFHDSDEAIIEELNYLNNKLISNDYDGMIHMADLISKRGDYKKFNLEKRKSIFWSIFYFSKRVPVKISSIFVNKNYMTSRSQLTRELGQRINKLLNEYMDIISKYDQVVIYYDNGQGILETMINMAFSIFDNIEHREKFDRKEKRLFQVADMLTCLDKLDFKRKEKIEFTKSEKYFFNGKDFRQLITLLSKKRL